MRIIECDRCHKRITGVDKVGYVALDYRDIKTGNWLGESRGLENWDFCDECMEEIAKFVQMKPVQERQKDADRPAPQVRLRLRAVQQDLPADPGH